MKKLAKLVLVAAIGLGGCASIPPVSTTGVQPSSIVSKIECEIYVSAAKPGHEDLKKREWIAVAALTLQGDDMFGVNPSLSYINPLSATTNFMFSLGGGYNEARQQIFSLNVTFDIMRLGPKACEKQVAEYELTGNLGLDDIIDGGLTAFAGNDPAARFVKDSNAFGSTLKFVITKSASGGPNWTLTHFTGPGGTSGLLSANRVDTQQLIISFVPQFVTFPADAVYALPPSSGAGVAPWVAPATEAAQITRIPFATAVMNAQNNNLNMLFQSLRTVP